MRQLVNNVLDAFDECDPARILVKAKLHCLAHIPEDIPRFGPMVRSSTEVHESYNTVFRRCSVLSNKQAPSRDIAIKFADLDRVKHLLSGGYWREGLSWVQAGCGVRGLLTKKPVLQDHLGWSPLETDTSGKSLTLSFCLQTFR